MAMKSVPAANTKSAPKTEKMAAGKPKAQYGALGSISAKKTLAKEVKSVPTTGAGVSMGVGASVRACVRASG